MIQKIKNALKKRKVKLFLGFLLCSFLAWFISNLSEPYTNNATFDLKFVNIPENKMLMNASKNTLDVKLEAVGFQFLRFNFNTKNVDIDLSKVEKDQGRFFIPRAQFQKQIEKQLSNSMRLLQIVEDTLFFDFQEVGMKEVPVEPRIKMDFGQNYLLDGALEIEPATVKITGPMNEIDTISVLKTPEIVLMDLVSDFSRTLPIVKSDALVNSTFSEQSVTIRGKVSRFSEKIVEVPIRVVNLPKNMSVRTFPEKIEVLCKAKISDLKNINSTDFQVTADYNVLSNQENTKYLSIELREHPKNVHSAVLIKNKVEYILKRE